jgi:PPOX class probable F420-dependent enzyme
MTEPILDPHAWRFLSAARRAVLATIDDDGRPRLVPICFVLDESEATGAPILHTPLDDKPKRTTDPLALARARDIVARPAVTILVDRWSEDWTDLAWLRARGEGVLLRPGHPAVAEERARAIAALRAKYPQYEDHDLASRPLIRITLTGVTSWAARGVGGQPAG